MIENILDVFSFIDDDDILKKIYSIFDSENMMMYDNLKGISKFKS
jgi:hypothetical protein